MLLQTLGLTKNVLGMPKNFRRYFWSVPVAFTPLTLLSLLSEWPLVSTSLAPKKSDSNFRVTALWVNLLEIQRGQLRVQVVTLLTLVRVGGGWLSFEAFLAKHGELGKFSSSIHFGFC